MHAAWCQQRCPRQRLWGCCSALSAGCAAHPLAPPPCSAKLKLDRLRRRGKAPPKKGAGKRAGKKK